MKDGNPVELSKQGARWLKMLHRHAKYFGERTIRLDALAAGEECEREVRQEVEEHRELENETKYPPLLAVGERAWAGPRAAMELTSATEVGPSQGVSVRSPNRTNSTHPHS